MNFFNPKEMLQNLWKNRGLIVELTKRELNQRYRGSYLGVVWSVIVPLITLGIYTFVFSYVFKARWQTSGEPTKSTDYALILFAGLTAFNIFSDIFARAPMLVIGQPNYVKKVVFPLEIYPVVNLSAALTLSLINIVLLVVANIFLAHNFSRTLYLLPLAYLPLVFICLAMGWFLSSLGVFIRDLAQAIPVATTILFYISPIVYPIASIPKSLQPLLYINPLTTITESFRQVLLWGGTPPWIPWCIWTVLSMLLALLGYAWFMGTKKGFADVV